MASLSLLDMCRYHKDYNDAGELINMGDDWVRVTLEGSETAAPVDFSNRVLPPTSTAVNWGTLGFTRSGGGTGRDETFVFSFFLNYNAYWSISRVRQINNQRASFSVGSAGGTFTQIAKGDCLAGRNVRIVLHASLEYVEGPDTNQWFYGSSTLAIDLLNNYTGITKTHTIDIRHSAVGGRSTFQIPTNDGSFVTIEESVEGMQ